METVSDPQKIIELQGVSKRYGRMLALNDITLEIGPGITGLLGPNGSGKSTLIKSLMGLLRIQSGTASVLGFQLPRELRAIRDHVGYLPEDDCFFAGLSGIDSVRFMARLSGLPSVEALRRAHEVIDFADIGQERYRNVETYSTGMRQKLKFAQAIVHDPDLVILDEPTSGLDPEQRIGMLKKIKYLAKQHGKSILISTHILHDVSSICEQVVIMSSGRIRLVDSLVNLSKPTEASFAIHVERRLEARSDMPFPDANRLMEQLRQAGIECSLQADGVLWVAAGTDDCSRIWKLARDGDVYIKQLAPAKNSLEKVFFDAVQEVHHAAS